MDELHDLPMVDGQTASPQSSSRNRLPWVAAVAIFLCFSILYIGLRTGQYNGDMVWQARTAEGLRDVDFKADHLMYGPMVRGIYLAWQAVGLPGRALIALQTVNALFGGVMIAVMFLIMWHLTKRPGVSIFTAALFGLTPYIWRHATDVETYATNKMFQTIAIYFMFLLAMRGERSRPYLLAVAVGVFHAMAAHFQYLHVMLVPGALAACMLSVESGWRKRFGVAGVYLGVVGVLVWVPYLYIAFFVVEVSDLSGLWAWLVGPAYGWPAGARMGVLETPMKLGAGFLNWATPLGLPTHQAKRVLLGDNGLGAYLADFWWRIPIVLSLGAVQAGLIWRLIRSWRHIVASWRNVVIVSLFIIVFYQAFHIYWGGFFMNLAMPAYVVMLALAYVDACRNRREEKFANVLSIGVPAILAIVATAGLVFAYIPQHDPANNEALQEVKAVSSEVSTDDLVFGPGGCLASEYWAYFAPIHRTHWLEVYVGPEDDRLGFMLRRGDRAIEEVLEQGGRVFVHRLFADEDHMTRPWNEMRFAGVERKDVAGHFRRYPHEEIEIAGYRYWEITGLPEDREVEDEAELDEPTPAVD